MCSYAYIKGAVRACTRFSLSVRSVVVSFPLFFLSLSLQKERKNERKGI